MRFAPRFIAGYLRLNLSRCRFVMTERWEHCLMGWPEKKAFSTIHVAAGQSAVPRRQEYSAGAVQTCPPSGKQQTAKTEKSLEAEKKAKGRATQVAPGYVQVGHYEVRQSQLPELKALGPAFDASVVKLQKHYGISEQAALRLYLGCNLDMQEAVSRYDGILQWRQRHRADDLRQTLLKQLADGQQIRPPNHELVSQLAVVNPCALRTLDGSPVSIFHVGSAKSTKAVHDDHLQRWSIFTAEYVDIWLTQQTLQTGRLAGHVQIYDLENVSFWQISSGSLVEKLKILLGAGQNYMEHVSHIFVIRSGSIFSMAWKFVKGWISPRTASKINVSSEIPRELLQLLGSNASALLPMLKPQWTVAMQRPPEVAPSDGS
eukprot:s85_g18.t1